MKFLLFADLHYAPKQFLSGSFEILHEMQAVAERENCDFIIHAGDFCHGPSRVMDFVEKYNNFHIPSYHCLGNHDSDNTPFEETVKLYNMPNEYYYFDCKGYRMIVLNPNYYFVDGEYVNFSMRNYFANGPTRDWVPPEQLAWLKKTIDSSPCPCLLISHESFERANGVQNRADVLKIVNDANAKKPHSVLMCMNGHYHRDYIRILDGVCYFDVNSVLMDWVQSVTHDRYPAELCEEYKSLNHTVIYNDPLYCIVELDGTTINIKGKESSMYLGVTREDVGGTPFDKAGRPVVPMIQSAKITLD
ncbi:MAG: metallophosphoesterase [Clostridia bacterium]|nr:metallophosphoesterase [Clostridia bacterium]